MKYATPILAVVAALVLNACTSCPFGHHTTAAGKVEHIVLVWLKKPGNSADRATVIAATKQFQAGIRQIQHISVGQVVPSDRDIVDDSFDVGFVMRFANKEDMTAYEQHPVHVNTVKEKLLPLAKKILVYDIRCE